MKIWTLLYLSYKNYSISEHSAKHTSVLNQPFVFTELTHGAVCLAIFNRFWTTLKVYSTDE